MLKGSVIRRKHKSKSLCNAFRILRPIRFVAFVAVFAAAGLPSLAMESSAAPQPAPLHPDHRWVHFVQGPGGLSSNDVWAIATTDDAVWVGTDRGVSRYDGIWLNFAPATSQASGRPATEVPYGTVRALAVGADGHSILAGTDDGRVYRWEALEWYVVSDVGSAVTSLVEHNGVVYAGTEFGVHSLPTDGSPSQLMLSGKHIHCLEEVHGSVYAGTQDGLWSLSDGEWRLFSLSGIVAAGVYAVSPAGPIDLAVGTPFGIAILNAAKSEGNSQSDEEGSSLRLVEYLPVSDELERPALVQALADDAYARLWAGTDGAGAYEFDGERYVVSVHGQANDPNVTIRYVRDVAVDVDGSIWFATPTGVYRYQVGMWQLDVRGESLADPLNHINDLLEASDGTLWIATGGGGVRSKTARDRAEIVYGVDQGVPSRVLVLEEDLAGDIWAGTFYGLFRYHNGQWELPVISADLPNQTITALRADGPLLWIGTENGLARYDSHDETMSIVSQLKGMSVEALALDGLERLWVGTRSQGAWVREASGEWTQHVGDPDVGGRLPADYIISGGLAPDWRIPGNMWTLVSRHGLLHWDGAEWSREAADNQISVNLLWMLESEANPGRLWVGSEGGVTQYDGRTWGTLSQDDGMQSASAYAIERTADGAYWIGGATGLSEYRPDSTPPWVRITGLSDHVFVSEQGSIDVPVGDELVVSFAAGDLQTLQSKLLVLQRVVKSGGDEGAWRQAIPGSLRLSFTEEGDYELQFVARDQSFNYSEIVRLPITVFVPPPTVDVPGLGAVETNTFVALIVLGSISLLGTGYILFEVLQHRRRSIDALNRGFNPYISGEPVRSQEMFFGRRDLLQRIIDTLHNNSVMIHGERRIGKTTLLYQLATLLRDVEDADYWFVPVYVDLEGTPEQDFFHFLIEEIVHGISRLPGAAKDILPHLENLQYRDLVAGEYDDRAFHRDLRRLIDALDDYGSVHHAGKQLRLILLLDEMDVMSRYDSIVQQQMRRIFMREFASTVGAVVAGIRISKDWDRIESPWYNLFNEIALEPFTEEDVQALLIEPVEGYYRYEAEALDFVIDHAEGRPYRVQQYGLEAVNHMLAGRRRRVTLEDVLAAHERIPSVASRKDRTATHREEILADAAKDEVPGSRSHRGEGDMDAERDDDTPTG